MFDEYWEELRKLPKRKISTIYLDTAEDVLKDMKKFLSKETEEKYSRLGIPYKKNYLFEGIPGTGKSSLVFSLASELNKDICIVNFDHKTTDSMFTKALTRESPVSGVFRFSSQVRHFVSSAPGTLLSIL